MNKIKIMLTAIAVFAVVGGALALKAKTQYTFYCTDGPDKTCPDPMFLFSTIHSISGTIVYCSTESHTFFDCGTIRLTPSN